MPDELKESISRSRRFWESRSCRMKGATVRLAVKTPPSTKAKVVSREWRRFDSEVLDREGIELSQKKGI